MAAALTSEHAHASLKSSDHFDYTEVKNKYMEQVKMYYSNRKLSVVTPFTRDVVNRIKKLIKENLLLMAAGRSSENAKYKVAKKYEVYEQNGEEILICKRLQPGDPIVQVVPAEDCFDILVDAHLQTKHGSKEKMLSVIKKAYVVPKTSIDFLLVVCKVCNLSGKTKRRADERIPHVFHARGQVSIIDMTDAPDSQFHHILCYIDRFTRFMLLRPLMTDSVQETATELLKIFFDFGPPEKLETYNRPFFLKVMSLINTAHSEFNIGLVLPVQTPVISPFNVRNMLCKWQNETGCSNWAMGCYKVQWKINSEVNFNKPSPYLSVFKCGSVGSDQALGKEKAIEDESNNQSEETESAHHLHSRAYNSFSDSSTTLICDDDEVLTAHQDNNVSEDDDDCLITFTEVPGESATIVTLANKPSRKRPNILRNILMDKRTDPTTISKLGNTNNNNNTLKELKQVEGNDLPKPAKKKCHVCKTEINRAYLCTQCKRNVHLFCSDRLLQPNIPADVLTVICTSCKLTNAEYNNKKCKGEKNSNKTTAKH